VEQAYDTAQPPLFQLLDTTAAVVVTVVEPVGINLLLHERPLP
jgi:hypothetical protein